MIESRRLEIVKITRLKQMNTESYMIAETIQQQQQQQQHSLLVSSKLG